MNRRPGYLHLPILAVLVILQTTLFRFIQIQGAAPDLVLIFLVFAAHARGPWEGQIFGFASGFLEDLLSLAPFGFNCLVRTVTGYLMGLTRGKIFFDPLVIPVIMITAITLFRQVLMLLISLMFLKTGTGFFGVEFWIELGMNVVLAPLIFNLFRKLGFFNDSERDIL